MHTSPDPAKFYLLATLLAKDRVITNNGRALLKELILRRDKRLLMLLQDFETTHLSDVFVNAIHALIETEAHALYLELFEQFPLEVAKSLSKIEREANELNNKKSLIYGEIDFQYFARVLRKINPTKGCKFYDLGSGSSKALFVARFLYDFKCCCGIEILGGLNEAADSIVQEFRRNFAKTLDASFRQDVHVECASFLDTDWSDGDVVFANSTCFEDDLMADMGKQAEKLKPGAFFITFTKGLGSDAFEVLERKRYCMSWGTATVFIQARKRHDGTSAYHADLIEIIDDSSYDDDFDNGVPGNCTHAALSLLPPLYEKDANESGDGGMHFFDLGALLPRSVHSGFRIEACEGANQPVRSPR